MKQIIRHIERDEIGAIKNWLVFIDNGQEELPEDFQWFLLVEKLKSRAFNSKSCNVEMVELTVEIYERIYSMNKKDEGPLLSSVYARLRAMKMSGVRENESILNPEFILVMLRQQFGLSIDKVKKMAENWKSLEIQQIKELRRLKNWINILNELESITGKQYAEFNDWKPLKSELP